MATKLAMPAPLAKSAILSGVDRPGLGEGQLRADSPLPAQFMPFCFAPIVGYSRWISDRLNSDITIPVIPALSDNGYHLSSSIDSNIALRRRTKT